MSDNGFIDPAPIPYDNSGTAVQITTEYKDIFNHLHTSDCPLVSCDLYDQFGNIPFTS